MSTTINNDLYKTGYAGINRTGDKTVKAGQKGKTQVEGKTGYNSGISVEFSKKGMEALEESGKKSAIEDKNEQVVKSSEYKLSSKAQSFLDNLRKNNSKYDFIVADPGDDFKGLVKQSDKEITVVFSSAEIERMASDPKYAAEKMHQVETVERMNEKINEQFGFRSAFGEKNGEGISLNNITVSFDDDGNMKLFAELEKTSEKQAERIEKNREKRAEEKKEAAEKFEEKRAEEKDADKLQTKKVEIEANSPEELMEQIGKIDWNLVAYAE